MIFRVNKTKDYTVMSNTHLRDKRLSLKAKGMLSMLLSLPDDWNYSVQGLIAICREGESAVKASLAELKDCGYLRVIKKMPNETDSGRIEYEYEVYEKPQDLKEEKQTKEKQDVENQGVKNQGQLNTNKLNTNKLSTNNKRDITRHKYGEYQNVLLSDDDLEKLKREFPDWADRIERLSEYMASTGKPYKNHLATIRNWARRDKDKPAPDIKPSAPASYDLDAYRKAAMSKPLEYKKK